MSAVVLPLVLCKIIGLCTYGRHLTSYSSTKLLVLYARCEIVCEEIVVSPPSAVSVRHPTCLFRLKTNSQLAVPRYQMSLLKNPFKQAFCEIVTAEDSLFVSLSTSAYEAAEEREMNSERVADNAADSAQELPPSDPSLAPFVLRSPYLGGWFESGTFVPEPVAPAKGPRENTFGSASKFAGRLCRYGPLSECAQKRNRMQPVEGGRVVRVAYGGFGGGHQACASLGTREGSRYFRRTARAQAPE